MKKYERLFKYRSLLSSVPKTYLLLPLLAIVLFLSAMGIFLFLLRVQEQESRTVNLVRNAEWVKSAVQHRLFANQSFLLTLSNNISNDISQRDLEIQTAQHMGSNIEILSIAFINRDGVVEWGVPSTSQEFKLHNRVQGNTLNLFNQVKSWAMARYSPIYKSPVNGYVFQLQVPIYRKNQFHGTVAGWYVLDRFFSFLTPQAFQKRYGLAIVNQKDEVIKASSEVPTDIANGNERTESAYISITDQGAKLKFKVYLLTESNQVAQDALFALVIGLSILVIVSFIALLRHTLMRLKAEQVLDRFFNLSLDLFCVIRADGAFQLRNPAFMRLLGGGRMTRATTFFDFIHPDDRSVFMEKFSELTRGDRKSMIAETRCLCGHGGYRWLEWAIHADAQHRVFYAAAHDVTQRKNRELDLAAERAFQKVIENSIITAIRVVDLDGNTIYVNPAFCRMTGYAEEDLLGKGAPFPYWHTNDYASNRTVFERMLLGDLSDSGIERQFVRSDGNICYAKLYMSPVVKEGHVTGWMTMFLDITERKRAQEAIEAAYGQFMRVFDSLDMAVSVCVESDDNKPELLFANKYYERIFGDTADGHMRLIKNMGDSYAHTLPIVRIEKDHPIMSASRETPPVGGVIYCEPKKRWFDVRIRYIRWIDNRVVQLLSATDITDQKIAEEMHARQQETLQFNSRLISMGEMASSVAHEINQPLTAIANYAKGCIARVQARVITEHDLIAALEKVSYQAERAGKIIRRIREFVQKSEPNREMISITSAIENAIGFAELAAKKKGIRIDRDIQPMPMVLADNILIEQVIFNLLKNAIEAMDGAQIPCIRMETRINGGYIEVRIIDHGYGISQEDKEQIYTAFYTTKAEGMGMGLNICRSIIEVHGGRIWCESNPHGGTIFTFTLPVNESL